LFNENNPKNGNKVSYLSFLKGLSIRQKEIENILDLCWFNVRKMQITYSAILHVQPYNFLFTIIIFFSRYELQ